MRTGMSSDGSGIIGIKIGVRSPGRLDHDLEGVESGMSGGRMTAVPQWTERVVRPVTGQDHLGVGSVVTDRILPSLSPGINVLTPHPRYWSFYAFVVHQYWKRSQGASSRRDLLAYLRTKEAIFSIAGHLCPNDQHRGNQMPVGSRKVSPLVDTRPRVYRPDFDYMKSAGGGYGLYYATVMQTTGVVHLADPSLGLPADAVTPATGQQVAEAFGDAIAHTRYWKKYWDKDEIPAAVVEEYAEAACLCRLRDAAPDRQPLVDVFLHGGTAREAAARRLSLQMMLELSHQTRAASIVQEDFRRLVLYHQAYDDSGAPVATFKPGPHLASVARRWRLSQLREMFNYALNGMWALVTNWGLDSGGDYAPLPLTRLDDLIASTSFRDVPSDSLRMGTRTESFIERLRSASRCTDSLDGPWDITATLTEDSLLRSLSDRDLEAPRRLGLLITLYVLTLSRLWDPDLPASVDSVDWAPVVEGKSLRVGMALALQQLRTDATEGVTVTETLRRVLHRHVIAQHERVAINKLPEDTFRFRREMDRIRFYDKAVEFSRNSSRFDALATTCAELGWTGFLDEPGRTLTPEGRSLRTAGDLPGAGT